MLELNITTEYQNFKNTTEGHRPKSLRNHEFNYLLYIKKLFNYAQIND